MPARANNVRIVLVRPRNPLNIGAAARAMVNFGFDDLAVVAPHEPVWQESRAAPGAEKLLQRARVVPHLLAAIEDRTCVIATSSLARRNPPLPVVSLDQLSAHWKKAGRTSRVAILFGSEKTGLSNQDLEYCHWIVRIPTTPESPSMNLGQAVAVCCYELARFQGVGKKIALEAPPRAAVGEIARLVDELQKLLREMEAPTTLRDRTRQARLRQTLLRWPVTSPDMTLALGVLRDLAWRLRQKA